RRQNGWHCELGRAYRWYGKFLRKAGRTEAAMEAFEQAADLAPSNHDRSDRKAAISRPIATSGIARNTPARPYSSAAASRAKITTSGCTLTAPPISLGTMMWPSIWWMNRNRMATPITAVSDSVAATAIGASAPSHGPR